MKWFHSYLTNRKQFTRVDNTDSDIREISYGVPQGSVLGPLLFLIYINDLNKAIKFSFIRHFADDTNILYANKSLRKINQRINFDLKNIVHWLRANRIALKLTFPWWGGFPPRSFYPGASTRRAQLSIATEVVRPIDLLKNVRYWFTVWLDKIRKAFSS